jgi:hypothetical protein
MLPAQGPMMGSHVRWFRRGWTCSVVATGGQESARGGEVVARRSKEPALPRRVNNHDKWQLESHDAPTWLADSFLRSEPPGKEMVPAG